MTKNEIIALRETLGFTQAQFAECIQSRQNTVALWEMGKHKPSLVYQRILKELKEKTAGMTNKARTK